MSLINNFPVISIVLGCFLLFFILCSKNNIGENKIAKTTLAAIVLIYTIMSLGSYLSLIKEDGYLLIGFLEYISFHFIGFLIYYFILSIINVSKNINLYLIIIFIYTLIRIGIFLFLKKEIESMGGMEYFMNAENSTIVKLAELDHIFVCLFNLFFSIKGLILFKVTPLILVLDKQKEIYYRWGYTVIIINIIIISIMMINVFIAMYDFNFLSHFNLKINISLSQKTIILFI
jgi:hypothetical protein